MKFQRPLILLFILALIPLSILTDSLSAEKKKDSKPVILEDGEFEVPKVDSKGIILVNNASPFKQMMYNEVLPALGEFTGMKPSGEFDKKIIAFAEEFGEKAIDCLIRVREPFMVPIFAHLIKNEKWSIRRLAIFGLQRNAGITELDSILARLSDENFMVREIAAMTVAIMHNLSFHLKDFPQLSSKQGKKAMKALKKRKKADIKALSKALKSEANPYVRSAIEASIRALGKFKLRKVCNECTKKDPKSGVTYILRGGRQSSSSNSKSGGKSKMPVCRNWCYPISIYPFEVISGISSDPPLVPLPAKNNSLHFGHDCGWMMPGMGVYAIGDGQLRTVELAGDFGVLIIGEYRLDKENTVVALNGHSSIWAFADPGPVKCRQLLGAIGLGFSVENGIYHAAHNHFGMRKGPYDRSKCFGRGGAGTSTNGWLVPAKFLGPKVVGREIDPDSY